MILVVFTGSIYAANSQEISSTSDDLIDDDKDTDLEDVPYSVGGDCDNVDDEPLEEHSSFVYLDEDSEFDEEGETDFDNEDVDENESDVTNCNDFNHLNLRILIYLEKFGNCSDENWTQSEDFISKYQAYLVDNTSYELDKNNENYETYLKIYNSIVSTFDGNLTDNETAYLKFLIMYYFNNYGNCSNYTWNESDEFSQFYPSYLVTALFDTSSISAHAGNNQYTNFNNQMLVPFVGVESNSTSNNNVTSLNQQNNSIDSNLFVLLFVILMLILMII